MATVYHNITEMIGNTPMIRLCRYEGEKQLDVTLLAKLEYYNPAGSLKDRTIKAMLDEAKARGLLHPDSVIIEATAGNSGIALAAIGGAAMGYKVIIVMPDSISNGRKKLPEIYGAQVVLSESSKGTAGMWEKAEELAARYPHSFIPRQFSNLAGPAAHRSTTGPEIWEATGGKIDVLVVGVGSGGTITGAGEYLKAKNSAIHVVAVEPAGSPLLSKGITGRHAISGLGATFIPDILNTDIYDEIISVKDEDAMISSREIARVDGLLVGPSSGAALWAAHQLALRPEHKGKSIVTVFPDAGSSYIQTRLFDEL